MSFWSKAWSPSVTQSAPASSRSFAWPAVSPVPPLAFSPPVFRAGGLIYEVNVRGFTMRHPEVPLELRNRIEDVVLNRKPVFPDDLPADAPERELTATERLIEIAQTLKDDGGKKEADQAWRKGSVQERITYAMVHGITQYIVEDTEEARQQIAAPLSETVSGVPSRVMTPSAMLCRYQGASARPWVVWPIMSASTR